MTTPGDYGQLPCRLRGQYTAERKSLKYGHKTPQADRDGYLAAYWRRPEAYLDPNVRAAISSFSKIGDITSGLARLRGDLDSGAWRERYGDLFDLEEFDYGYRIVVAA